MPRDKAKRKHGGALTEHGDKTQAQAQAQQIPNPRPSKFKEGTMNSTSEIRAPPDEVLEELSAEHLLDRFEDERDAPASLGTVAVGAAQNQLKHRQQGGKEEGALPTAAEGPLDRFSRAVASFFHGAGATFSGLGKRKAGSEHAEGKGEKGAEKHVDDRKAAVDAAYLEAKENGLLPTPKVFVRPVSRAARASASSDLSGTHFADSKALALPRTPGLYHSPSKKDLQTQETLSRRVSELENKLLQARKELRTHLDSPASSIVTRRVASNLPSPPSTATSARQWSEASVSPQKQGLPVAEAERPQATKVVKKRKVTSEQDEHSVPVATESDPAQDTGRDSKKAKTTPSKLKLKKRASSKLLRKRSSINLQEDAVVVVVPDGENVPPIPAIPKGVEGKKAKVGADGYGGFEHEMF